MELEKFYRLEKANGVNRLIEVDNPLPQDGYRHEPDGWVDIDGDEIDEEFIRENDLPFSGVIYAFAGDCMTVEYVREGVEVDMSIFDGETPRDGVYYYRTGIYEEASGDEEEDPHTGWDAVMWFQHESDPNF